MGQDDQSSVLPVYEQHADSTHPVPQEVEQHAEPTDEQGKKPSQKDIIRMDATVHLMFIAMVLICADVAADISTVGLWAWLTTGCTRRMLELWQSSPLQRIYLPVLLALLVLSTVVELCFGRSMVIRIDFALGTGGLLFKVAFSAARRQTHPPIATPQDPSGGTPPADVAEPPHGKDLLQFDWYGGCSVGFLFGDAPFHRITFAQSARLP